MTKVIQAINVMIGHPELITGVNLFEGEYFFLYNKKYQWSIKSDGENGYKLYYYTQKIDYSSLGYPGSFDAVHFVTYDSADYKTREAFETFRDLYLLIQEKLFGVDAALDDIIQTDDIPL